MKINDNEYFTRYYEPGSRVLKRQPRNGIYERGVFGRIDKNKITEFTGEEKGNSSGIDGYYSVSVYDAFLPDTPLISAVNMGERSNVQKDKNWAFAIQDSLSY
jgi:hypothetical protein